jgi:hypothetical protein
MQVLTKNETTQVYGAVSYSNWHPCQDPFYTTNIIFPVSLCAGLFSTGLMVFLGFNNKQAFSIGAIAFITLGGLMMFQLNNEIFKPLD